MIGSMGDARAGTEKNLLTIIEHLDHSQFEPFLVSVQDCDYIRRGQFICETSCLHINRLITPAMLRVRRRLAHKMQELKIDIVQTFFTEGHLLGGGAARSAGIRNIISSRRNLGYAYTFKEKLFLKFANRYPRRWLANCEAVANTIARIESVPRSCFDVIYNGIELGDATGREGAAPLTEPMTIVMVANLRPIKSVATLIKAAVTVVKSVSTAQFILVGDGPQRGELEQLARNRGIANHITFAGGQDDVMSILEKASVGVLTSLSEGCANAILEYMRSSLPVVATAVGGNRELVVDGETGFLITAGDTDTLAEKLIYLLNHGRQAQEMGRRGYERVVDRFSLPAMMEAYQAYYLGLLNV